MDKRLESKQNLLNAIGRLIGTSEDFQKISQRVRENSMKVYDIIESGYYATILADPLADLLNDLSEIFEKGVVSDVKSEQEGGAHNGSR